MQYIKGGWRLVAIADQYFASTNQQLLFNDMSLAQGGLFDISANWTTPHIEHQFGADVDINPGNLNSTVFQRIVNSTTGCKTSFDTVSGANWHTTCQ